MEHGHMQRLPSLYEYPLLSQEWVKLCTNFKFCRSTHILSIDLIEPKCIKNFRKSSRGRGRMLTDSRNSSGHPYIVVATRPARVLGRSGIPS